MSVAEILQNVRFVIDTDGTKKAVLLDYSLWKELLTQLENLGRTLRKFDASALIPRPTFPPLIKGGKGGFRGMGRVSI